MKLNPEHMDDTLVVIRNELFVAAAVLATLSDAASSNFEKREEEAYALIIATQGKIDEILGGISDALEACDRLTDMRAAA